MCNYEHFFLILLFHLTRGTELSNEKKYCSNIIKWKKLRKKYTVTLTAKNWNDENGAYIIMIITTTKCRRRERNLHSVLSFVWLFPNKEKSACFQQSCLMIMKKKQENFKIQ